MIVESVIHTFRFSKLSKARVKLQLHDAIYRLRFYSNSSIHILSLSNSHNNLASIQKNWDDKSHRVIVALHEAICLTDSFVFKLGYCANF